MSFIGSGRQGTVYAPGYFLLNNEDCTRETREIAQNSAFVVTDSATGGKYVPMGTPYPTNTSSAVGIVYEDVDVSTGNMPGSVVTSGIVYENRLPVDLDSDAKSALIGLGFKFVEESSVVRPYS